MRHTTDTWTVGQLVRLQRRINFAPHYQRDGGAWNPSRKALLIDSLINNFDIPKIYLHKMSDCGSGFDYNVVDGRQRLETILEFLRSEFALAHNFVFEGDPLEHDPSPVGSQYFEEFSDEAQQLLRDAKLDVVLIDDADIDDIEELFSRLNNGEKLTAAEVRNAIGGDMTDLIRQIAEEPHFKTKFAFANRRYNHYEVACKLLLLENQRLANAGHVRFVDLKKKFLDSFVKDNKQMPQAASRKLLSSMRQSLKKLDKCFDDKSPDLSKQSHPPLMYLFVLTVLDRYGAPAPMSTLIRTFLESFRNDLALNRTLPTASKDPELVEFGRLAQQGTNDSDSLQKRVDIMIRRFLAQNGDVSILDQRRRFNDDERTVIWLNAKKRCQNCNTKIASISDMDADHVRRWADGGKTTLSNARCLCATCNRSGQKRAA